MNTNVRKDNLAKMVPYLLNGLRAEFNMEYFAYYDEDILRGTCGSCGCVVGHATFVVGRKEYGETWQDYCKRVFGITPVNDWTNTAEFDYLFSEEWVNFDNTPVGAALRIIWFLKEGKPGPLWESVEYLDRKAELIAWFEENYGKLPPECLAHTSQVNR